MLLETTNQGLTARQIQCTGCVSMVLAELHCLVHTRKQTCVVDGCRHLGGLQLIELDMCLDTNALCSNCLTTLTIIIIRIVYVSSSLS